MRLRLIYLRGCVDTRFGISLVRRLCCCSFPVVSSSANLGTKSTLYPTGDWARKAIYTQLLACAKLQGEHCVHSLFNWPIKYSEATITTLEG